MPRPDAPLLRAARREPTAYTPVWLMRQAGRYLPEYRALRARHGFLELCKNSEAAAEVTLQPVERLGVDAAILFADILLVAEPLGMGLEFPKGEGPVIQRPVRTAADVDRLPRVDAASDLGFVYETVRRVAKALDGRLPLIGFAGAPFTVASYLVEGGPSRDFLHTKRLMYAAPDAWHRLLARLVDVIVAEYRKAWHGIYPLELEYQRSEMQPQFANIATPSEIIVATSFTLEIGDTSGAVHFCIPYSTLEPIRDVLYSTVQGDSSEPDRRWINLLKLQIQAAEVELVAELANAPATVEQLLAFKPGDFIELDLEPLIHAKVDGVPVFDCHYGTSNGRYALKIDQLLTSSNTGWIGVEDVN